jgi:RHS repeat-associated protein
MIHTALSGSWTRNYQYDPNSNRLLLTSNPSGSLTDTYDHDAHGNMTSMPHLQAMQWSFKDHLQSVDLGGGGNAYYTYDSSGQRVRKVWEKQGGLVEERIYLGGYEVFRRRLNGGLELERETLHIMDDKRRVAMVETKTVDKAALVSSPVHLIRCQFDNHLGSASLELDEQAAIISYEENYPYGNTSYQAVVGSVDVSPKRYRYTGKEKDEESGLYYYGARYYISWLGRWLSSDPAGQVDGNNLYVYVVNNPIIFTDPSGYQHHDSKKKNADLGKEPQVHYSLGDITKQTFELEGPTVRPRDNLLDQAPPASFFAQDNQPTTVVYSRAASFASARSKFDVKDQTLLPGLTAQIKLKMYLDLHPFTPFPHEAPPQSLDAKDQTLLGGLAAGVQIKIYQDAHPPPPKENAKIDRPWWEKEGRSFKSLYVQDQLKYSDALFRYVDSKGTDTQAEFQINQAQHDTWLKKMSPTYQFSPWAFINKLGGGIKDIQTYREGLRLPFYQPTNPTLMVRPMGPRHKINAIGKPMLNIETTGKMGYEKGVKLWPVTPILNNQGAPVRLKNNQL